MIDRSCGARPSPLSSQTSSGLKCRWPAPMAACSASRKLVLPALFSPMSTVVGPSGSSTARRQRKLKTRTVVMMMPLVLGALAPEELSTIASGSTLGGSAIGVPLGVGSVGCTGIAVESAFVISTGNILPRGGPALWLPRSSLSDSAGGVWVQGRLSSAVSVSVKNCAAEVPGGEQTRSLDSPDASGSRTVNQRRFAMSPQRGPTGAPKLPPNAMGSVLGPK